MRFPPRSHAHPADAIPFGEAPVETPRAPGDRTDVGVLFVELTNAATLAAGRSAAEVSAIMRTFLMTVGEVTTAYGGYVDRRKLGAVLCVFGGPASSMRASDRALASGRDLHDRLVAVLPGVKFGIGISVAPSVAGWIRASRRFERLAISAPVSEAKRLSGVTRRGGPPILASERALGRASPTEAGRWSAGHPAATIAAAGSTPR